MRTIAQARFEPNGVVQRRGHGAGAVAACLPWRAAVADAARAIGPELASAGALWGAPARLDDKGDDDELDVNGACCASATYESALLVVVELDIPERPQTAELFVNVGEAVGKGKEVGADHDLEVEVGKEEGAMFALVAKGLVGIVVAKGVEVGGRVKVRREWGGEVEREIVPVGVFGAEIPNDAPSGGQETFLANDDRREATPEAHRDLLSSLDKLECVDDCGHRIREFANRAGYENIA